MPDPSSPRVALLGFSIECNKFAPVATKAHFLARTYLEGDAIVEEARSEARAITRHARSDHDRLLGEVRRMRSLLRSALALVDDEAPEERAA